MYKVFLGIGGNLGNKSQNFKKAYSFIKKDLGEIISMSSVYETPPWGFTAKTNFWNQVLLIETDKSPHILLSIIHDIEKKFARERKNRGYVSREMDIDILYYDDLFIEDDALTIPHPYIQKRLFVLVPLVEIAPDLKHPLLRQTSLQMLENCKDTSVIKKVDPE